MTGAPAIAGAAPASDTWVRPSPPQLERGSVFFHDPRRGQWVLVDLRFRDNSRLWTLPDAGARVWSAVGIAGTAPRYDGESWWDYDFDGDRLVAGGIDVVFPDSCCDVPRRNFLDPYTLVLGPNPRWEHVDVVGDRPLVRGRYATAYDPRRQRLLVFPESQYDSYDPSKVVFAIDLAGTPHWSVLQITGAGPSRITAEAVVDSVRDRLLMWGGRDTLDRVLPDVWALPLADPAAWEALAVPDTLPEFSASSHPMVLDPQRDRLVACAAFNAVFARDSVGMWEYDLAHGVGWTLIVPPGRGPRAIDAFQMAIDQSSGRVALFGGYGRDPLGQYTSRYDLFELDAAVGASWMPTIQCGQPPRLEEGSSFLLDRKRRLAFALDGSGNRAQLQLRQVTLGPTQDWEFVDQGQEFLPSGRDYCMAVFDSIGDRGIVFGGRFFGVEIGDLWQVRLKSAQRAEWLRLFPGGEQPSPRWGAGAVFDPVRRRLVMFGGFAGRPLGDTWALSLDGPPRWTRLATRGISPIARYGASAVYDSRRDGMIVFGGNPTDESDARPLQDAWFLSFADGDTWFPIDAVGSVPVGRWFHAAVYDPQRDRMLVFWGRDRSSARFDCAALDLSGTPTWSAYLPQGSPSFSRYGFAAAYDPDLDRAVLMGGRIYSQTGDGYTPDWYLDFAALAGGPPPLSGPPFALLGMSPNPTRAGVDVAFDLPASTVVRGRIYDARGRLVRDLGTRTYLPGRHVLSWDGAGDDGYRPRPGVYFARLVLGAREITGKLVLLP